MPRPPVTKEGYEAMKKEAADLERLLSSKGKEDIPEPYGSIDGAKNRLESLNKTLKECQVMEPLSGEIFYIQFGCSVLLGDVATGKDFEVRIVGSVEEDPARGYISVESTLGRVLLGKSIGQAVKYNDGKEIREYEIMEIYR